MGMVMRPVVTSMGNMCRHHLVIRPSELHAHQSKPKLTISECTHLMPSSSFQSSFTRHKLGMYGKHFSWAQPKTRLREQTTWQALPFKWKSKTNQRMLGQTQILLFHLFRTWMTHVQTMWHWECQLSHVMRHGLVLKHPKTWQRCYGMLTSQLPQLSF